MAKNIRNAPRYTLRLPGAELRRTKNLERILKRAIGSSAVPKALVHAYALCPDERKFALGLLDRRSELWLFRTHQRRFCGDFVAVNMSAAKPEHRRCFLIELKRGAELRLGGGGAGIQLKNRDKAIVDIAQTTQVLPADAQPELVVGDRNAVLAHLGAKG
ncbi:MAG: hypothetical protein AAGF12_43180 [Myxococcota bacterium]